uniref:DUF6534 domain-containing protein n=1 Tax=Kwoniella dejecticola CBS 10117 TaxID=1296121 RepID=A0A1A6AH77_9TREE|nr:uncharacterized protein I303_01246 [Kwoniella dejecticola CBS 10117]OBR89419.1 hypothetical protein I303_01246 [Kwoniella dejecticola CBS 10117]
MSYWPPGWYNLEVYAPYIVGLVFSGVLLGVVWVVTYNYYTGHPEDKRHLQIFIAVVCLLTTLDTVTLCGNVVELAKRPGDFVYVLAVQVGAWGTIRAICSAVCTFLVQGYMIHVFFGFLLKLRYQDISALQKVALWGLRILIGMATLLGLGATIAAIVWARDTIGPEALINPNISKTQTLTELWSMIYGTLLGVDVALTVGFSVYLHSLRTGFVATNRVINTLVKILLRNGLLATSLQLASLVLYKYSNSYWIAFPNTLSSKIYVLTLLSLVTQPRSAREQAIDEGFKPPTGVSRVVQNSSSSVGRISNTSNSNPYQCHTCRHRILSVSSEQSNSVDPRSPLSFVQFLTSPEEDSAIPIDEDVKGSRHHDSVSDAEKGLIRQGR